MENEEVVEMEKELYVAAMKGNVEFLEDEARRGGDAYLRRKTHEKNSIIHIAIRHEQHEFIEACLRKISNSNELIQNSKGNTSFHVAAEVGNLAIMSLLCSVDWIKGGDGDGDGDGDQTPMSYPWRVQNSKGNTPVHVAIIHDNVKIARFLLEKDPYLARIVNNLKEAPLHLAIKHHVNYSESESIMTRIKQPINEGGAALVIKFIPGEDMLSLINCLLEKASRVACWADTNGLTALHRAAFLTIPFNVQVIRSILYHCPQSAEVCDSSGKSILHLLISKMPSYQEGKNLLKFTEIYALRNYQDQQGNTPLHVAAKCLDINMVRVLLESSTKLSIKNKEGVSVASLIQQHNLLENQALRELLGLTDKNGNTLLHLAIEGNRFDIVQVFLDTWGHERESLKGKHRWLVDLLEIRNKAGKTPGDLIAESLSLPPKIEKSIGDKYEMIGVRSMWGIPTTQMKTYVNTMGIIAALLTTITFTAAFTVPGGLIQDEGTPVLIERAAFHVFMISDVLAMCLSMMVLFCLLWIMATNNKHNSVMILDFSITLLLASLYATIVTFMAGLFATMFSDKPWIAIVTLVLCSLLMLLVHKFLVIKLLIPFKKATLYFVWMFLRFARTKFRKWCAAKTSKGGGQVMTRQLSMINV